MRAKILSRKWLISRWVLRSIPRSWYVGTILKEDHPSLLKLYQRVNGQEWDHPTRKSRFLKLLQEYDSNDATWTFPFRRRFRLLLGFLSIWFWRGWRRSHHAICWAPRWLFLWTMRRRNVIASNRGLKYRFTNTGAVQTIGYHVSNCYHV